jgi:hypothetical protein
MLKRLRLLVLLAALLPLPLLAQDQPDSTQNTDERVSEWLRDVAGALESAADAIEDDSSNHDHDDDDDEHDHDHFLPEPLDDPYLLNAPFERERGPYRQLPALRYNRVEGFVLGIGLEPIDWQSDDRTKIHGQLGYAFAARSWRYTAGLEVRPFGGDDPANVKLGLAYRRNTATNDAWKTSWTENSLASFFFKNDFFDYYEVQGVSAYGAWRAAPGAKLSLTYRSEAYHHLERETGWALFGGSFRRNPLIEEGRMHSVTATLAGRTPQRSWRRGLAYRLSSELGRGLGGDFSFNRYVASGRVATPLSARNALDVKLRGGWTTAGAPTQKRFTLGGVGSVRGYPQNAYAGTRMIAANAAVAYNDPNWLGGDLLVLGLFDAGYVDAEDVAGPFESDQLLASAGVGLCATNTALRFELMWPLRAGVSGPTLWIRLGD